MCQSFELSASRGFADQLGVDSALSLEPVFDDCGSSICRRGINYDHFQLVRWIILRDYVFESIFDMFSFVVGGKYDRKLGLILFIHLYVPGSAGRSSQICEVYQGN